jgi:hypothetical protein
VGRHEKREAALALQLQEEIVDDGARLRIQVTGGLIGEDHLRPVDERARDGDALLLTAGQLAGPVMQAISQPDLRERGAAGIGADYAIYFLYRLREERARCATDAAAFATALHTSGRAVLFVAASIGAGFAVMGFSCFLGMRLFGTLMPAAMAVSCLAALSIMPVLVLRTRPAFVFGQTVEPIAEPEPGSARA